MKKQIKLTGILAIIGATIMFIGDMLLYFTSSPVNNFQKEIISIMGNISPTRLIIGGAIGPLATGLYIIGYYQIYLAIKPTYKKIAKVIFAVLSFGIIYGGSFHAFFPILGFMSSTGSEEALILAESYSITIFNLMFIPSLLAYLMLTYLILTRKTYYPRWIVFVSPFILFWLSPLVQQLPQPFMMVVAGGWSNLIFILFFSVSTYTLIKNNDDQSN
jgi:hypothetical protein